jgi:hypothetical protein
MSKGDWMQWGMFVGVNSYCINHVEGIEGREYTYYDKSTCLTVLPMPKGESIAVRKLDGGKNISVVGGLKLTAFVGFLLKEFN